MLTFRFVKIDKHYRETKDLPSLVWAREDAQIAGVNFVGSLYGELHAHARTMRSDQKIVILNQITPRDKITTSLSKKVLFPFRFMWKSNVDSTLATAEEALIPGNYFLCFEHVVDQDEIDRKNESIRSLESRTYEYRYHCEIEDAFAWKTKKPAYVNLDRTSESIGQSSWDGNLVSWFECGFQTRIQFARHSGLLPED